MPPVAGIFRARSSPVHARVPNRCPAASTVAAMRTTFHDELDQIGTSLVEMSSLAGSAMGRATTALLDADLRLAESVISGDAVINALYRDTEERAFELLARQQPVASD